MRQFFMTAFLSGMLLSAFSSQALAHRKHWKHRHNAHVDHHDHHRQARGYEGVHDKTIYRDKLAKNKVRRASVNMRAWAKSKLKSERAILTHRRDHEFKKEMRLRKFGRVNDFAKK